ncbi:MAG: hypothetical protein U0794_03195 [Isosphaeraceae bacterium]
MTCSRSRLAAAGVQVDPSWKLDGVNLLPFLKGEVKTAPHDALYWRLGPQGAIRKGDWKLVRYDRNADAPVPRTDRANPPVTPFQLYNLATDIGESHPVNDAHPEKVRELTESWEAWSRQLARPLWGGPARAAARAN